MKKLIVLIAVFGMFGFVINKAQAQKTVKATESFIASSLIVSDDCPNDDDPPGPNPPPPPPKE